MTTGQAIRYYRKKHGMNQAELAYIVGMSREKLAKIEANIQKVTDEEVKVFAKAFGITSEELLNDELVKGSIDADIDEKIRSIKPKKDIIEKLLSENNEKLEAVNTSLCYVCELLENIYSRMSSLSAYGQLKNMLRSDL